MVSFPLAIFYAILGASPAVADECSVANSPSAIVVDTAPASFEYLDHGCIVTLGAFDRQMGDYFANNHDSNLKAEDIFGRPVAVTSTGFCLRSEERGVFDGVVVCCRWSQLPLGTRLALFQKSTGVRGAQTGLIWSFTR